MHRPPTRKLLLPLLLALVPVGCGGSEPAEGELDDEGAVAIPAGKADSAYGECELKAVLALVNDSATTVEVLAAKGVHKRARENVMARRNGPDGLPGTADDAPFETAKQLDDVPYVGPVAFGQLVAAVGDLCVTPSVRLAEAIFSPQPKETSHLAKVESLIDTAQRSIDIAMYSFRWADIEAALARAVARGVSVRMVFQTANDDRKDPAGTASARLEDIGVDVRYINKIMHHKFAIIDGPRTDPAEALTGVLATGSGNWSSSAGTRFDENTVVLQGSAELVLRFQREFNHLWSNSRDFEWNPGLQWVGSMQVTDAMIVDDPSVDAVFTSANFTVTMSTRYGATFSTVSGSNAVADRLVELIAGARRSIDVASGHLRSRPVAEALLAKAVNDPDVAIRVYLDGQEYLSSSTHRRQEGDLDDCLEAAGDSESKQQSCMDKGFLFSYALHAAGIPLRYKYYAYRWDYSYAPQMHHKYMLFDGETVASGSYNLSDNAEHQTMENVVFYHRAAFPELVDSFYENFDAIWETGRDGDRYAAMMEDLDSGTDSVQLVFDPMALAWDEAYALKRAILAACPEANSQEFRTDPAHHTYCRR